MTRHCERSEAIQGGLRKKLDCFVASLLAVTRSASEGKHFTGLRKRLDCFVASLLAMTRIGRLAADIISCQRRHIDELRVV